MAKSGSIIVLAMSSSISSSLVMLMMVVMMMMMLASTSTPSNVERHQAVSAFTVTSSQYSRRTVSSSHPGFSGPGVIKRSLQQSSSSSSSSSPSSSLHATVDRPSSTIGSPSSMKPSGGGDVSPTDNFESDILDDMQICLSMLQRRADGGPGTLSSQEVSTFEAAMSRIADDMQAQGHHHHHHQQQQQHYNQQQQQQVQYQEPQQPVAVAIPTIPQQQIELVAPLAESHDQEESVRLQEHQEHDHHQQQLQQQRPTMAVKPEDEYQLKIAVSNMDVDTVTTLIETTGLQMDEATADAAFWEVVKAVDLAEERNEPLSGNIPRMLHHIFDADLRHLLTREKITKNVTCMQPDESQGLAARAQRMSYIFDDSSHKDLPLTEGRVCEGGHCCDKCSRNIFPTFATDAESSLTKFPELCSLTFNELETVSTATIIQFVRLVERVRRTIAHEYGLPLSSILPLQAYSRKYVAGMTQQGGGGGEGDFVTLHTDEATHSGYHYSCVLYLSTQGVDFEGGDFVFNDPAPEGSQPTNDEENEYIMDMKTLVEQIRRAGRELTPFHPKRGAAVIFSSGWENMHEVETITSGIRYAVPCFFTTCPVPEAAYEQMAVGKPKTNEDIADDWLHLLLAHRHEKPMESVGRVKELLMKWHFMCTPLSQH